MIKKYKQFINESWTDKAQKDHVYKLYEYTRIPKEEFEDYFLRLEEIFEANIKNSPHHHYGLHISIRGNKKFLKEAEDELNTTIKRIEEKYNYLTLKYKILQVKSIPDWITFELEFEKNGSALHIHHRDPRYGKISRNEKGELINPLNESWTKKIHSGVGIKTEDLEDYFLRLEEILGCKISQVSMDNTNDSIRITCKRAVKYKVIDELEFIKSIIEDRTMLTIHYRIVEEEPVIYKSPPELIANSTIVFKVLFIQNPKQKDRESKFSDKCPYLKERVGWNAIIGGYPSNGLEELSKYIEVPKQDVDDYFLRLIEVFRCELFFSKYDTNSKNNEPYFIIIPRWSEYKTTEQREKALNDIEKELEFIKERIEESSTNVIIMSWKREKTRFDISIDKYLKESTKNIRNIVPDDELDDQFLRLREILHCEIFDNFSSDSEKNIKQKIFGNKYENNTYIIVVPTKSENNIKEIHKELENIKMRMESMYSLTMKIESFDPIEERKNRQELGKDFSRALNVIYGNVIRSSEERKDIIKISLIPK